MGALEPRTATGPLGPVAVAVAAVSLLVGGCATTVTGLPVAASQPSSQPISSNVPMPAGPSSGPCKYTPTPTDPAPAGHSVGLPADPTPTPNTGTVTVTLNTNDGDIPLTLNRAQAPCTVQSFVFLSQRGFYDDTPCHRLTAYPTPPLDVLQCGDPTGSGTGGPGYTIPDENPTGLAPAPSTTPAQPGEQPSVIYPAGTIAMANTGQPNSGGSQFFLVYADSQLPPTYAVFGKTSSAGLAVLAGIAAGGIKAGTDPTTGEPSQQDGAPAKPVTIEHAAVQQ